MTRNETATCKELIEPALAQVGWTWDKQLRIGPGRVNLTGDSMYDETQANAGRRLAMRSVSFRASIRKGGVALRK